MKVELFKYYLQPGFIYINKSPSVVSTVIGTCVVVCLWDFKKRFGGANHFVQPLAKSKEQRTVLYGNIATPTLIKMMTEQGSKLSNLEAQIIGGGIPPHNKNCALGKSNIEIAEQILNKHNIPVVSHDIGGYKGRKLYFHTEKGESIIHKVETVRTTDWYPKI